MTILLRPQDNPELFGHHEAERHILSAIHGRRLPHAWLISGCTGIGKATLGYRFARYLLAGRDRTTMVPDSLFLEADHRVFQGVRRGSYPDLLIVERGLDPRSQRLRHEISIDDIRTVQDFFNYTVAKDGWRVVLIDGVDLLNHHGQNALLKVLEEPPLHSILLLISSRPGRVLSTVRSRCRSVVLRPLTYHLVVQLLGRFYSSLEDDEKHGFAILAEGSIGRALTLVKAEGTRIFGQLMEIFDSLPRFDWNIAYRFVEQTLRRDNNAENFMVVRDMMLWWLARLACVEHGVAVNDASILACDVGIERIAKHHYGVESWADVWASVHKLLTQAEQVSLDRQQAILTALTMIKTAASQSQSNPR